MKITIVAGARPNFIKIAPITRTIDLLETQGKDISYRLIYTGKKEDSSLEDSLFKDLDMKAPDAYLEVENKNSTIAAAELMIAFEKELDENPADTVLVVDDLTSTMACSIVAKKRGVKVAHLMAGTRSFDISMPKEVNRIIVNGLSDYHFTAGMDANRNLSHTGTEQELVYQVGNILIDNLRHNLNRFCKPDWFDEKGFTNENYLLLTINRRALLANAENFAGLIRVLTQKAGKLPIIAPLHTYVSDAVKATGVKADNLHIVPPQSYLHFGFLTSHAKGIITDSGNVAEEATFLGIPCITLNKYAEHPETCQIGTNELVGEEPDKLAAALDKLLQGTWKKGELPERWDGHTAERIMQILTQK